MNPDFICSPSPLAFINTLVTIARLIQPEAVIANNPCRTGSPKKAQCSIPTAMDSAYSSVAEDNLRVFPGEMLYNLLS